MLREILKGKRIKVQRLRLRDAILRIYFAGTQEREKKDRLHRLVYKITAPNHLWHIYTNHKLVRWRFIILDGVDGFNQGISDQLNGLHLIALHYIYMDKINRRLDIWTQAWASHRMRTTKSSPVNIWIAGQIQNPVGTQLSEQDLVDYGLEGNIDAANLMDDGRPIF
ncbi:unnamed protein product [Mytilus edulis]|uniref:Integrase core domain-containing protein n=1 Tax=Mytilus edulis TaxID=6550 RepID=A0A8S3QRG6_MYTED|nr:unnamed protein product [Mytilus edulis]